jgi:predicted ATPase
MQELPTGTVTFLFTDIEGSTRLLHELGAERYAEELAEHRTVLRDAFARHGGVEVDTQGDAFFVAFPTAPGAFAAAQEAQEALSIPVRMGLHTGTPLLAHEGYVGADVHRAARIAAAGHGGQVLVSAATAALLQDRLRDLGEHRLKDLSAPERIYQAGESDFPPLKTLYATNLPVPATPFLGRERELKETSGLLFDGVRLLTLSGPGGTGKTRLALQATAAAADEYPDGIWWVPLAPLADPALVLPAAGEALGAKGELQREIADKRLLLLLDNFEHVIDAAGEVAALLGASPNLTVLVTSRERLQLAGEHEYAVPAMASSDGLELFSARARALGTEVDGGEAARELCERLDNLPLALELAAARTKLFSPAQLLERLGKRLDLFKGGRDADPRQRTLRATIEWSYDLLTPEEQQLFASLSVFPGGCTYEAAEAICDADEDTLQSLLDKSLLRRREDRSDESRYWMLETIRQFAGERLEENARARELRDAHLHYFVDHAERKFMQARAGGSASEFYRRLQLDEGNIRAALACALERGETEALLRLTAATWRFFWVRGHLAEARTWIELTLARASVGPLDLRAYVACGGTAIAGSQGDTAAAERFAEEALRLFDELGEPGWRSAATRDLSNVVWARGDAARARTLAERALRLAELSGDPRFITPALAAGAELELFAGDVDRAEERAARARALALDNPNEEWNEDARALSGYVALARGDGHVAESELQHALCLASRIGFSEAVASCLCGLSAAALLQYEPVRAARLLGATQRVYDDGGFAVPPLQARTLAEVRVDIERELGPERTSAELEAGRSLEPAAALEFATSSSPFPRAID